MIKYPRTYHLPWSQGKTSDDKTTNSISNFIEREIVITEKMDGENTTFTDGIVHARSLDSKYHESRTWVNNFLKSRCFSLPEGWRICGENLFAKHSLEYTGLSSYFYGFSVWTDNNISLSWDDTQEIFNEFGITPVKVLFRGIIDENSLRKFHTTLDPEKSEGYVIRLANSFHYDDFKSSVAKWVRAEHVQTDTHWMKKQIVKNKLKSAEISAGKQNFGRDLDPPKVNHSLEFSKYRIF